MADLTAAVRAHRLLAEQVRSAFPEADEETVADSVDAATELDQAIVAVVRAAIERELLAAALGERIKEMVERKRRLEAGAEAMRRAVRNAMVEVNWRRLPAPVPDLTITVANGTPRLVIVDERRLPDDLVDIEVVRKPRRAEIKAALQGGADLGGAAHLSNAEAHLTISRR
jgi:hypothetical protein